MMLAHLGKHDASAAIMRAIEAVMFNGPKAPDMGGQASTKDVGEAISRALCEASR